MRQPVVYILASAMERALYTTDMSRRLEEHRFGRVTHTAKYMIDRLNYLEPFDTAPGAIAGEKQLKGWTRAQKLALINRSNPDWRELAGEIGG